MSTRSDNRLADAPMVAVTCTTCGVGVEARKSSWEQTSIQWREGGQTQCLERRAFTSTTDVNGGLFRGCAALRDSVHRAVAEGRLAVLDPSASHTAEPEH